MSTGKVVEWAAFGAVLFDLDGVVTPTAEIHERAWAELFAQWGFDGNDYLTYVDGRPRYDGVKSFLDSRGVELPWGDPSDPPGDGTICALGNRKDEMFNTVLARQGIEPYPGTLRVMDVLDRAGVPSAIVSSSKNAGNVLRAAGITERFTTVVDGIVANEQHLAGKPDPATFVYAAKALGVTSAKAVVVEDASSGVAAGRAGNFAMVVGVDRGGNRDALVAAGADIVVDDLDETLPVTRDSTIISIDRERFPVDPWRLVETRLGDEDGLTGTLFATGNGYLGLRGDRAPDPDSSGTYVNGFHEAFPIVHAEHAHALARTGQSLLNAPEGKSIELKVGDQVLRLAPGPERSQVTDFRREIDFRSGVLRSELLWHTRGGGKVRVTSDRLVSLQRRHLAVLRLTLEALDTPVAVTINSQLVNRQDVATGNRGAGAPDPRRSRTFDRRVLEPVLQTHDPDEPNGGTVTLGYRCVGSGMTIAAAHRHTIDASKDVAFDTQLDGDRAATTIRLDAARADMITLTKYLVYHTSSQLAQASDEVSIEELAARCSSTLDDAESGGWEQAQAEQQAWLERFWARTDIAVDGDDTAQQAIRWNLFQMAQASAQIGGRGIAAKAVTAAGYDGHYFWDTEVYMVPLLAYTNPDAARDLLHFRHRTLPLARQRAEEMSQRGALFPWRTINGEEASAYYPAGTAQYHIDADVAHAIDRYVTATGDTEYLDGEGAEILVELARLFADLGFYDDGEPPVFHIHGVTGPDEYTAVVDDNLYTNVTARFTLWLAAGVASRLQAEASDAHRALVAATGLADDEVAAWTRAADSMCVLYDETLGINPQDDAFLDHQAWDWKGTPADKYPLLLNFHPLVIYRHQVLKQADVVLAMFLRGDEFAPDLQRRNFDYYDPITTGDSSLSACVQSIMAAEVGHDDLALHYFRESLYLDIADTHGNTVDGAHIANVGGVWACLVHGFAGFRDSGTHIRIAPRLPAGWQAMRFHLHRRGGDIAIAVDPTGATVTVESGEPVPILVDGTITEIAAGGSLRVAGRV